MRNDVRATNGLSSWLAYSINPRQLRTALRPAGLSAFLSF